jgi:hypothetical protein
MFRHTTLPYRQHPMLRGKQFRRPPRREKHPRHWRRRHHVAGPHHLLGHRPPSPTTHLRELYPSCMGAGHYLWSCYRRGNRAEYDLEMDFLH